MTDRLTRHSRPALAGLIGLALVAAPLAAAPVAASTAGDAVVINEVYLNGGSAGATFTNKYIELYNPTSAAISLVGKSLQYRAPGAATDPTGVFALTGSIPAKGTYLVQGASNAANGVALTSPDDVSGLNPGAGGGTFFLANKTTALTTPPTGSIVNDPAIIDLVGWGTSNTSETAVTTTASVTTSLSRTPIGTDSDSNSADLTAGTPSPTNSAGVVSGGGGTTPTDPPPTPGTPVAISAIQGAGDTSPVAGQTVTTRGVVTANYATGGFAGYYIQTPGTGGDIDLATHTNSDGLFIYSAATAAAATLGSYVEVTGVISEFQGTTEMTVVAGALTVLTETVSAPLPADVTVPTTAVGRESLEGMLIAPAGDFTVTDNYSTNYYGSVVLNPGTSPLISPTTVAEPGSAEYTAKLADNLARAISLDDGSSLNFNSTANKATKLPYLSTVNPVRIGAAVDFTKPVILEYRFSAWNFQPTQQLTFENAATVQPASFENTRTEAPLPVGGDITLASFNVLNYFATTGDQVTGCSFYTDRAGAPVTVNTGCDARGAANAENLQRQQDKIVAAINALDADVVSLEEIENSARFSKPRDFALSTLVTALNADAGAGTWSFVPSPAAVPASEDVIRTAFIYKSAAVRPVGTSVILDSPAFSNARQPLAQEFELADGAVDSEFLAIVNHFKSKGSGEGPDADQGDGQGASNASRVAQATALVDFADTLQYERDTDRVFLLGDFNAYLKEDPIDVISAAGYVDLGSTRTEKETYAFDGAIGSLDHIFASAGAIDDVAGVDIWNINSVESIALEYSRYNYNALDLYEAGPYRSSDHDPVVVGLDLAADATEITGQVPTVSGTARVGRTLSATAGEWTPSGTALAYRWKRDGVAIAGAVRSTYLLTGLDATHKITVSVTGTSAGLASVTKTSAPLTIAKGVLTATPTPKITGTAKYGSTLKLVKGAWGPAPVTTKYQWKRNGVAISGATASTYKVRSADRGKRITVAVTGTKVGYTTVAKASFAKVIAK